MSDDEASLLGGRRTAPLTDDEVRKVANVFLGLSQEVDVRYDPHRRTCFVPEVEEDEEVGRIYYSADIYPGPDVIDPNSALSMPAAAAHELSHFYRWRDKTELPDGAYRDLDEALTSLDAMLRYDRELTRHEVLQLGRDAIHRLQRLRAQLLEGDDGDS